MDATHVLPVTASACQSLKHSTEHRCTCKHYLRWHLAVREARQCKACRQLTRFQRRHLAPPRHGRQAMERAPPQACHLSWTGSAGAHSHHWHSPTPVHSSERQLCIICTTAAGPKTPDQAIDDIAGCCNRQLMAAPSISDHAKSFAVTHS